MDKQQLTITKNNIRVYESDIEDTKKQIETKKEMVQELLESTSGWLDVQTLKERYEEAKISFHLKLQGNADYNDGLEELAQLKEKLKEQKQIQSDFIVGYFAETKERQIELGTTGNARDLVVTGKLGKSSKYQPSLFSVKE